MQKLLDPEMYEEYVVKIPDIDLVNKNRWKFPPPKKKEIAHLEGRVKKF